MAANPLFQSYHGQVQYTTNSLRNHNRDNKTPMAQRSSDKRGKRGGPQKDSEEEKNPKKRRLEKPPQPDESGDWDDLEFTQQDLENLDVIASQAIETGGPSTSKQDPRGLGQGDTQQTLDLGSYAGQDQPGLFHAPAPGGTVRVRNRSSTSSVSNSDSSVYPQSSESLRKTPSSDLSSAPGSLTSSKSSSNVSMSSGEPPVSEGRGAASGVSAQSGHSKEVKQLKDALHKAQAEVYAKEGENKHLKDALHKQEQELEKLREERDTRKDVEEEHQKEREKELKQEVERLKTQAQFNTQEHLQLQERCRNLESKLMHQQTSSPSRPQPSTSAGGLTPSQPTGSPDKSPKVRKVEARSSRTQEKGAFPSHQSFMSPRVLAQTSRNMGTMTEDTQTTPSLVPRREKRRHVRLSVPCLRGTTLGAQLVSQLLRCGGEVEDGGIVELLQTLPSRLDLIELKYQRDGATDRLSPVRKARRSSTHGVHLSSQAQTDHKPIVEREHFLLAMHGLRQLIDSSACSEPVPVKSEQAEPATHSSGALLLLPMLNDYLKHYLDIISCSEQTPVSPNISTSSNKSSSEVGSSLESLTSSLGVLLQQGAEYANNVETLTLCALRVLNTLVCACEDVRSVCVVSRVGASLLRPATDTSSSTVETDQEKDKTNESGMEGDDEQSTSTSSSKGSSFIISPADPMGSPAPRFEGLNLLLKLLRLASPSHESSGFKASIVEAALDVLISLAMKLSNAEVDRLHVIVLRGILTECLQLEHQPGITVRALDLFCNLARSRSILPFLCTKTDACTLLNIHLVSTRLLATCRGKQQLQALLVDVISKVMDTIFSVVSFHRNGVHILTDNNCRCSGQIIPSLVHSMFYLLRDYQVSHCDGMFRILRKGVLLLHEISLKDPNFQQRHTTVQSYYSTLMSCLSLIYKSMSDLPQAEVSALEDLWEEQDDSDTCSQDSDHEERMETE